MRCYIGLRETESCIGTIAFIALQAIMSHGDVQGGHHDGHHGGYHDGSHGGHHDGIYHGTTVPAGGGGFQSQVSW